MDLQIAVDARTASGKATKRLRAAGIVPGVVFGKKAGSIPVQLDAKAFEALYREAGRTSIVKVTVEGGSTTSVVIKSVQRNPLTGRAVHVDFFAPDLTHEMQADVPIAFVGEAPAIEEFSGTLFTSLDHLKVKALPADMPHQITVDLSSLVDLDATIFVRDLGVQAETITVLNDPDEMVAKVMPPRVEEEPETVAEELEGEAEGEAAEGEAGAAAEGEGTSEADGTGSEAE